MQHQLCGGILTGGLARRLQSIGDDVDKGLLSLHGEVLVAHAAHKLTPYTQSPLLISANRNKKNYEKYGEVVADPDYLVGYQGPLAGIVAMLGRLITTDWLIVLPVDSPFLPPKLVSALWQEHLAQPEKRIFFVQHERTYPLCLLIHKECGAALKKYLLSGQRRVQSWLVEQDAVAVDLRHYPAEAFFNINEPADLQRAQELKTPSV